MTDLDGNHLMPVMIDVVRLVGSLDKRQRECLVSAYKGTPPTYDNLREILDGAQGLHDLSNAWDWPEVIFGDKRFAMGPRISIEEAGEVRSSAMVATIDKTYREQLKEHGGFVSHLSKSVLCSLRPEDLCSFVRDGPGAAVRKQYPCLDGFSEWTPPPAALGEQDVNFPPSAWSLNVEADEDQIAKGYSVFKVCVFPLWLLTD
jgi:hypothetical protein